MRFDTAAAGTRLHCQNPSLEGSAKILTYRCPLILLLHELPWLNPQELPAVASEVHLQGLPAVAVIVTLYTLLVVVVLLLLKASDLTPRSTGLAPSLSSIGDGAWSIPNAMVGRPCTNATGGGSRFAPVP